MNQPLIAIDLAPIHFDGQHLNIILGKRKFAPYENELALPGVLLLNEETLEEAALRAAYTKVGYESDELSTLKQAGAFDNSDRDPRGPTISILFYGIISDVRADSGSEWFTISNLGELPFDHNELIIKAVQRLSETAFTDKETLRSLLGDSFTTAAARNLVSELGININQTNLSRFMRTIPFIEETEETVIAEGRKGRPSKLWKVSE